MKTPVSKAKINIGSAVFACEIESAAFSKSDTLRVAAGMFLVHMAKRTDLLKPAKKAMVPVACCETCTRTESKPVKFDNATYSRILEALHKRRHAKTKSPILMKKVIESEN